MGVGAGVGGTVTEHHLFVVGVSPAGQKGKPGGCSGGVGVGGTVTEHNLFVVGVSPAGQKGKPGGATGGVGAGVGGSKGRVLMPKPSALLGAPTLGVPVACVTPDSVIHSPQSTGESIHVSRLAYEQDCRSQYCNPFCRS